MARLELGTFSYRGNDTKVLGPGPVKVGKFCSISSNVTFISWTHNANWITAFPFNSVKQSKDWPECKNINHPLFFGETIIGNDVWIGYGATIRGGIKIGDGAIIANNAVVTKDIEPYKIVGGVPAKVIKDRFSKEIVELLLKIKWWDWNIKKIRKHVNILCSEPTVEKLKDLI